VVPSCMPVLRSGTAGAAVTISDGLSLQAGYRLTRPGRQPIVIVCLIVIDSLTVCSLLPRLVVSSSV